MTDKSELLDLLAGIDPYVPGKIYIVAVGGTALTLLNIKDSTIDIDFNLPRKEDSEKIRKVFKKLGFKRLNAGKWIAPNNLIIDLYDQDYIFCVQLLDDSLQNSEEIRDFDHISLRALNLYDLIITKLSRSEGKDLEDIEAIFKAHEIDLEALFRRWKKTCEVSVIGDEKNKFRALLMYLREKDLIEENKTLDLRVEKWNL